VYHGQVLEDNSDDEDGDGAGALGSEWCSGKLKFKKHIDDNLRLGGDGRRIDDIIVIDTATITKR
jgi:peptidyl-prolyl cis-trans isomerase SDCCAG10